MTPTPDPGKIPKSQRRSPEVAATEYVNLLNDSVQAGFERLAAAQEKTELALTQLSTQVKQTNNNIDKLGEKLDKFGDRMDKLGDRLDKMGDRIDGHLKVAEQHARNIEAQSVTVAELTKLVTVLANRAV